MRRQGNGRDCPGVPRCKYFPFRHATRVISHPPRVYQIERGPKRKIGAILQVIVRDNNVDQALRVLKKKMQREGIFREMRARKAYEKPSERKTREKAEAIRRARKAARKQAQRDGLIPMPKKKVDDDRNRSRTR
jgi:small subunit ribosomal protein S21